MLIVILLCCIYAAGALWLFRQYEWLQDSKIAQITHLVIFAGQLYLWVWAAGGPPSSGGMMGAAASAAVMLCGLALICIINAPILSTILGSYLTGAGRWLLSLDQIRTRKTYDKAEAAAAKGEPERAVALYKEAIADDPEDATAYRRQAEIYLDLDRVTDATLMLRRVRELTDAGDDAWISATFRLAEVLAELPNGRTSATALYREIVEFRPSSEHAGYARKRLQSMDNP